MPSSVLYYRTLTRLGTTIQTEVFSARYCASKRDATCYGTEKDSKCDITRKGVVSYGLRRAWSSLFPSEGTGSSKFPTTGMPQS